MTFEGLAGTGIGGRTPLTGWGGVQIWGVVRIGRQWAVGVASRLGLHGGMDASGRLARRPDWESRADWTPVGYCGGVQIGDVWRIGRQSVVCAASRLRL